VGDAKLLATQSHPDPHNSRTVGGRQTASYTVSPWSVETSHKRLKKWYYYRSSWKVKIPSTCSRLYCITQYTMGWETVQLL